MMKTTWTTLCLIGLLTVSGDCAEPYDLSTELYQTPLGLDTAQPRFSWKMKPEPGSVGQKQTAYRLLVASEEGKLREGKADIWDSGKIEGPLSVLIEGVPELESRARYHWTVKLWDKTGTAGKYAQPSWFETGMLDQQEWYEDGATWIESPVNAPEDEVTEKWLKYAVVPFKNIKIVGGPRFQPTAADRKKSEELHLAELKEQVKPQTILRREFTVPENLLSARLYICGLGYHRAYINGKQAGDTQLQPTITDYATASHYNVHDVTGLLNDGGKNVIAVELVTGRWNSMPGHYNEVYHENPVLLARLEMIDGNGKRSALVTDNQWKAGRAPVVRHSFWQGEVYDANLEQKGWKQPGFNEDGWVAAQPFDGRQHIERLTRDPLDGEVVDELGHPISQTEPIPGVYVYDVGQQVGGRLRLTFRGLKKGKVIAVRYSTYLGDTEVERTPAHPWYPGRELTEKMPGMLYFKARDAVSCRHGMRKFDPDTGEKLKINLQGRGSTMVYTDVFVSAGEPVEVWQPDFTYTGFRYFEILGLDKPLPREDIVAFDLHTRTRRVGTMTTNDEKLNRVMKGIHDTFNKCFHSQFQDNNGAERNSSMGNDTHSEFLASYWFGTHPNWTKTLGNSRWIYDKLQWPGLFSAGQRNALYARYRIMTVVDVTHIGVIPHNMVAFYRDRRIIDPYIKWMEFYVKESTEYSVWNKGACTKYGDHIHETSLANLEHLQEANGTVKNDTLFVQCMTIIRQTRYIIATMEKLGYLEEAARVRGYLDAFIPRVTEKYQRDGVWNPDLITRQQTAIALDWAGLTDGEQSVQNLAKTCVEDFKLTNGHQITGSRFTDPILDLLSRGGFPDEAYRLLTREEYPSWLNMIDETGGSIRESWGKFDSSNQIEGFTAAGNWWYRNLVGIMPRLGAPAFREFDLRPTVPEAISNYDFRYDSPRGMIESHWKASDSNVEWTIVVPPNSTAHISVPGKDIEGTEVPGITPVSKEVGRVNYTVESGRYSFRFTKADPVNK